MEKITVVIPMFNSENTIIRTLSSLENQTLSKKLFKVIVVNDGSVDNSEKVVKEYKKTTNLNLYLFNKLNGGVSSARNFGIKKVDTEYLSFLDADDEYNCETLDKYYKNSYNNDLLIGNIKVFNQKNQQISNENPKILFSKVTNKVDQFEYLRELKLFNNINNKLYTVILIKKYNLLFNEKLEVGEDFLFNLQYFSATNKIHYIEYNVLNYYTADSFLTTKIRKNEFYNRKIPLEHLNNFYTNYGVKKDLSIYFLKIFYSDIYNSYRHDGNIISRINELLNDEKIKQISQDFKPKGLQERILYYPVKTKKIFL
ncbi:hypothetical protein BW732_01865 [Vagococcus penaei]|uniref:Glycosyltransferase 2-like domain-containing protein n=1 Tax=Vagococcus penaei TaxID=633807 RepID=A0A1Q2D4A0_9ENTE|nr:glycosyltransferase family 2 protein [Vagococcus penaei]AQP53095.1 hypothetical protein BW732_01865 [Vagococcus penaei]